MASDKSAVCSARDLLQNSACKSDFNMVIYKSPLGVAAYIFMSFWPRGQAVKTSPFHGGNTGSIPVGVTYKPMWLNFRRLTMSIAGRA